MNHLGNIAPYKQKNPNGLRDVLGEKPAIKIWKYNKQLWRLCLEIRVGGGNDLYQFKKGGND